MAENITVDMTNLNKTEREQLLALITKANSKWEMPKNLKPGDIFKDIDGDEWIFLFYEEETGNVAILKKTSLTKMKFGNDNNYNGCFIDKYLCYEYFKELERKFGDNIVEHEVDLLSLDGEDDYGVIKRKVSIPTLDVYRHNKKAIKKYIDEWFWLATPSSTPSGYCSDFVHWVDGDGDVSYDWYDIGRVAVRPFLFLNGNIIN